ncbi:hypothetical protein [Microbacterium hominis]|uniref:ApeA N-terminal domain 1-containing protein n=1 Tax=Microbacterium hominis TaxID=162426 RepID=UPI001E53FB94|nr:hypothetical protein [Microbacterium hominis]
MAVELSFGDSLAVLLVDGVAETPYVGATLRMDESGIEVEVPHMPGFVVPQFEHVDQWFRRMAPPENVLVHARGGSVQLFGCRWSGHSDATGSRVGTGRFSATEALLHDRDGALSDPLTVTTCQSRADGLNHWSRVTAVSSEPTRDEESRANALDVRVESPEPTEWLQGEARMRIRATWSFAPREDGYSRIHELEDNVIVESEWEQPHPFADHLVEQRKVLHLLVFLFGAGLSFREHRVRDGSIAARLMGGEIYDHPFAEVISARTISERAQPIPQKGKLQRPLLVLEEVGAEGLAEWASNYEAWERFILPAVSIIGRRHRFAEDIVMSTSMSLEAAGQLIGEQPGEAATYHRGRRTTATYVYRCLELLGIRWGEYIHSQTGLAKAIANNYNAVKHADRGAFPDHVETFLIGDVNQLIVRLLAIRLTGRAEELLQRYRDGSELWQIKQRFDAYRVRIADDLGAWGMAACSST